MNADTFCEHFDLLAEAPNGVAKLRELILQLAVQGKLVPQKPNDEPAETLLERISIERQQKASKEGARAQQLLPPISPDEVPYQLPSTWAWARLGTVGDTNIGLTYSPKNVGPTGMAVLRSNNIQNGRIELSDLVRVDVEPKSSVLVAEGDLLICARNGSRALVGKAALIRRLPERMAFGAFMAIFRSNLNEYLYHFIRSPVFRRVISEVNTTTINQITQSNLRSALVPIPPLAEQRRIVAKVDQLMGLCDELESRQQAKRAERERLVASALDKLLAARDAAERAAHWPRLRDHFDLLFDTPASIPQLRQAILQLAVQGQLVPHDPNDEPASAWLQRVRATLGEMIDDDQKRRIEKLDAVQTAGGPFALPPRWAWARFPELGRFGRGKSRHRPRNEPKLYKNGTYPLVQTGDVARANGWIDTHTGMYNEFGLAQSRLWPVGTLCITIAANIADSGLLSFEACIPDSVVGFIPKSEIGDATYFEFFMRTAKSRLKDYAPSTAQKNINLGILDSVLIPLPPLAEQKRIVSKVTELLSLCDALEAKLTQAESASTQLLSAAVHHLLAGNSKCPKGPSYA